MHVLDWERHRNEFRGGDATDEFSLYRDQGPACAFCMMCVSPEISSSACQIKQRCCFGWGKGRK